MTDPIADMLTRIRNAQAAKKAEVILPYSKLKYNLAKLMAAEGWLEGAEEISGNQGNWHQLKILLKYAKSGKPAIASLKRVSRPGRRIYASYSQMPYVLNGLGIAIISTSRGLITNKAARRSKIGGEVICEIY